MPDLNPIARRIRDFDNDRFISALFAPERARDALFTLYAFNLELSKIREMVSEPLIGRMRLQFWRDALAAIDSGNPPAHEIAEPLSRVVSAFDLDTQVLKDMVDARETDLDDVPPADLAAIEAYAEGTSSALLVPAMKILGVDPAAHASWVRHGGIAIALIGLVRAIPYQASTGRVTLPADLCQKAGLSPSDPSQWPRNPDVGAITRPMLARARTHLDIARQAPTPPKAALPALLPLSLAARYLRRLEKCEGDPARFAARPPGAGRHLTLLWRSMRGKP